MPAAMNRIDARSGESNLKLDPGGAVPASSADRLASFSSTCPAGTQRIRALGIRSAMILLGALGAAWAGSAAASDGVLEINQICAVQTGCFAGDTAGFPVTISASGSYRLTSNLVVPNENTDGIQVSTDDVGIDLNNFSILGPVVCSGTPLACVPNAGTGSGVERTSSSLSGISVRNGSIRGMGNFGVSLGLQSEVTNLRIRSNRVAGINVSNGSIVSGNTAHLNGDYGIVVGAGSIVSGNTAYRNRLAGIYIDSGSTISGNTAYQNGADGIFVSDASTVSGNTAYLNAGDGIQTSSGATVWGNTVRVNTGFGLNLGAQSGYRENVISSNTAGTVTGTGIVNLGSNACNGSTTCP